MTPDDDLEWVDHIVVEIQPRRARDLQLILRLLGCDADAAEWDRLLAATSLV
jgi:hypothetical protein